MRQKNTPAGAGASVSEFLLPVSSTARRVFPTGDLDAFLDLLSGVERQPSGIMALCPAHKDSDPSLSVGQGDNGGIVINCFAGCEPEAVVAAMGLPMAALMPPNKNGRHASAEPEKVYDYRDEQGELVRQKLRKPGKEFLQRAPDGKGGWVYKLAGVRDLLYGLPELLQSPAGTVVFICEGEKDADNVRRLGLVATTNIEGAAKENQRPKWKPEYTTWLREHLPDRRFVLLPDNDAPGTAHMAHVQESLQQAGLAVVTVALSGLPDKGDVSDWLAAGHTKAELLALSAPKPPRLFAKLLTFERLLQQPPPVWQIENLFFEESLVEIYGPWNAGKTFVAMSIAHAIRTALPWFGQPVKKVGSVLYVNADGGRGFAERARAWATLPGHPEDAFEFYTYPEPINLHRRPDMEEFFEMFGYLDRPPVVTLFDTYSRCIAGVNENQQEEASMVVDHLTRLKNEFHTVPFLLHHTDRSGQHDRGSSVIPGAMDTIARVEQDEATGIITVTCEKQRDGVKFKPLYFVLTPIPDTNQVWLEPTDRRPIRSKSEQKEATLEDVLTHIGKNPGQTREQVREALELAESSGKRYIETLILQQKIVEAPLPTPAGKSGPKPRGLFIRPEQKTLEGTNSNE